MTSSKTQKEFESVSISLKRLRENNQQLEKELKDKNTECSEVTEALLDQNKKVVMLEKELETVKRQLEKAICQRDALAVELGEDDDNGAEEIRLCNLQLEQIRAEVNHGK